MEKRYINEARYKKGSARKRRSESTVKSNLASKTNSVVKVKENVRPNAKKVKKHKKVVKQNSTLNIVICVTLLIIIAIISRAILKDENEPFIPFFYTSESNDETINIGVITGDSLLNSNTKNCVINELNKYSKDMLLEINEDYSITYKCISNVIKISNKEYLLIRDEKSSVTASDIKTELDNYRNNKNSVYYDKLKSIDNIQIVDENKLNITLKSEMPYFIYNLDICLTTSKDKTSYLQSNSSSASCLVYIRHEDANMELPAKIIVNRYKDMYEAVEAYKANKINIFVTDAANVENILGKYDYNIKVFRNGETLFLFGNPESKIYSKLEVRKAISHSLDRGSMINDVLNSKGDTIDLPYIYNVTKYKYDVYAAENLLLTNGYKKSNKVYYKMEEGKKITLELDLLVNKQDETKVKVAEKIKNNLGAIGIKINIEKLTTEKIESRIKKGDYDLILASVNLNNTPDISFVEKNLFITDDVRKALENINNSSLVSISNRLAELQNVLYNDVSAIGIYSDVSYLVYSKDIVGIDKITYMNLFNGILK